MLSRYTLRPTGNHKLPRRYAVRQFLHFLQVAKNVEFGSFDGWANARADLKAIKRWGAWEAAEIDMARRRVPQRVALIDDDGQLTYEDLFEHTWRLAVGLQERGVAEGANIGVLVMNGRAAILPLAARTMLGYNIFMLNVNSSPKQQQQVLDYHEIDILIVDEEFFEALTPEAKHRTIIFGHLDTDTLPEGVESLQHIIDTSSPQGVLPEKPAQGRHVVLTSGSTGMPKGVVRLPRKSPQSGAPLLAALPFKEGQTFFLTAVLFHMYGWACLMLAFSTRSTIVTRRHFTPDRMLDDFRRYNVDFWMTASARIRAVIHSMQEQGIETFTGLSAILSSGSPLVPYENEEVTRRFGPVLHNFYGSSETSVIAITGPGELAQDPALSGTIYPGIEVRILDDDGNELPDGEVGHVYTAVFDFFAGYTDPDIQPPTRGHLYDMGDKGYKLGNKLYVQGRADDLVITQFGEKIQPAEIVDLLVRDERIEDAYVVGVADEHTGQALRAYVIKADESVDADAVRSLVAENLSKAHIPRDVVFLSEFPRTATGKVIKPAILQL